MVTEEVYLKIQVGQGTNCTIRCDFGDDTPLVTVEGVHTPYNIPVVDKLVLVNFCLFYLTFTGTFAR